MKQEIILTENKPLKIQGFRFIAESPEEYATLKNVFVGCVAGPGLLSLQLDSEEQTLTFEDIDLEIEGMVYKARTGWKPPKQ